MISVVVWDASIRNSLAITRFWAFVLLKQRVLEHFSLVMQLIHEGMGDPAIK
jgi:hypothetical protein